MKSRAVILLALFLVLSLAPASRAQKAPTGIAGLTLGANVEDFRDRLDLARVAPLWDRPWLTRANLAPTKGFAAGYVLIGSCATPGRIVRMRLKYQDDSTALYDKLRSSLTARYGKPKALAAVGHTGGYQGARWVFGKSKAEGVDLVLEHFQGDVEEAGAGNIIRLTDDRAMAQEKTCHQAMLARSPEPKPSFPLFPVDESWLLPQ